MPCDKSTFQLEAFVDGECSADEARLVSQHLATCETCRERVAALRAVNRMVTSELASVPTPNGLWQRIESRLPEAHEIAAAPPSAKPWFRRPIWQTAIAATLLIMLALPAGLTWQWMQRDLSIIAAPIQDFATYRDSGRSLDIASRDPETIRSWFASRLTFEAPKLDAKVAGFDLIGGRLCWLLQRRLSAFAYERGEQKLELYVMTAHDLALPGGAFDPELGISLSSHEFEGMRTMIWQKGELVYTVVSNIPKQDMSIFLAALARSQLTAASALIRPVADHGPDHGLLSAASRMEPRQSG